MIVSILNKLISKLKRDPYQIDKAIPGSYILFLVLKRAAMLIRGKLSFIKNDGLLFIAGSSVIRCRSKLSVGRGVSIGENTLLDALSVEGIILGNNVSVGRNTKIEGTGHLQHLGKGIKVGNNVGLGTDCFYGCAGGIEIGDDILIGNYVSFHSENHVITDVSSLIRLQGVSHKGIKVGNNCWIGAKATILDGVVIENGCVIAAGAVVKEGIYKENGIYGGVPAKLLKYRT